MDFLHLLSDSAFEPDEIKLLLDAYERGLDMLSMLDRSDPLSEVLASKIIATAQVGENDPDVLADRAIQALNLQIPVAGRSGEGENVV